MAQPSNTATLAGICAFVDDKSQQPAPTLQCSLCSCSAGRLSQVHFATSLKDQKETMLAQNQFAAPLAQPARPQSAHATNSAAPFRAPFPMALQGFTALPLAPVGPSGRLEGKLTVPNSAVAQQNHQDLRREEHRYSEQSNTNKGLHP